MPTNPNTTKNMPPPPDPLFSDDPIASGDAQHSVTRNTPLRLEPAPKIFAESSAPPKIRQKKGKRQRPVYTSENPEAETDRDVPISSSSASSVADESEYDDPMLETPRQERQRRGHRPSSGLGFGEGPTILQREMAAQATLATNNAILSTVEILTAEVKTLKELITSLAATITSVKTQNGELKQGQNRLEQQIQRMGRQQRDPPKPHTTEPATGTNTQPINNRRTQNQNQPPPAQNPSGPNSTPEKNPALEPEAGNTWAKVARKGNEKKENPFTPAKRMERTIVVHRSSEDVNVDADIHHMRDTINTVLRHNKAPTSLTISGIQWNRRGNLTLTTIDKFSEAELAPHLETIKTQIEKFDKEVSMVGKQETWSKVIIHNVDTEKFMDNESGMKSLQTELETFNKGLVLASTPRYLTRPESHKDKAHSSCVIAMKDKPYMKRLIRYGTTIFGRQCKTEEYFSARPTDQCTKCQGFGHHYRRCTRDQVCGICADRHHDTQTHTCITCNSRHGCDHKPAKCANCGGKHKSNSNECEVLQAVRSPREPEGEMEPNTEMTDEL